MTVGKKNKRAHRLSIVLSDKVLEKIDKQAREENRVRANMIAKIVIDHYQDAEGEKKV